jgi:hypothetical protein
VGASYVEDSRGSIKGRRRRRGRRRNTGRITG